MIPDMGKKDINPVTKILFYEKDGKTVELSNDDLNNVAPTKFKSEKLYIMLR